MTRKESISYIHNFIKKATNEQLKQLICATFAPKCSIDCPLRQIGSCECANIEEDKKN